MVNYLNINCEELKELLLKDNVVLIDVRTTEEWYEKHLKGAYLLPLNSISYFDVIELCSKLNKSKPIHLVFYCRAGVRSIAAIEQVFHSNKDINKYKIYNLKNGILDCSL